MTFNPISAVLAIMVPVGIISLAMALSPAKEGRPRRSGLWIGGAALVGVILYGTQLWMSALARDSVPGERYAAYKSFPDCLIGELKGTPNDAIAKQIVAGCKAVHPSTPFSDLIPATKAYASARACVLDAARETTSNLAAQALESACYALYPPLGP